MINVGSKSNSNNQEIDLSLSKDSIPEIQTDLFSEIFLTQIIIPEDTEKGNLNFSSNPIDKVDTIDTIEIDRQNIDFSPGSNENNINYLDNLSNETKVFLSDNDENLNFLTDVHKDALSNLELDFNEKNPKKLNINIEDIEDSTGVFLGLAGGYLSGKIEDDTKVPENKNIEQSIEQLAVNPALSKVLNNKIKNRSFTAGNLNNVHKRNLNINNVEQKTIDLPEEISNKLNTEEKLNKKTVTLDKTIISIPSVFDEKNIKRRLEMAISSGGDEVSSEELEIKVNKTDYLKNNKVDFVDSGNTKMKIKENIVQDQKLMIQEQKSLESKEKETINHNFIKPKIKFQNSINQNHAQVIDTDTKSISSSNNNSSQQNSNQSFSQTSPSTLQTIHDIKEMLNMSDKRWANNLLSQIKSAKSSKLNELELVLTPKHLGKIKIKIGMSDERALISIKTDNASAASIIAEQENKLNNMFEQAGLKLGSLLSESTSQHRENKQEQKNFNNTNSSKNEDKEENLNKETATTKFNDNSLLNIKV